MSELLTTTVVGSYPQPDWLIDRERLGSRLPPRVRARELWRVDERYLEQAQDDATLLATIAAVIVAGLFDAVLLLALPTLIVWTAIGALWSPPPTMRSMPR